MKLGIFADSYACAGMYNNDIPEKSWINFISDTGKFSIENFSRGGTDIWFSYKKFIENHERFDKIIFLVTSAGRLHLPIIDAYTNPNRAQVQIDLGDPNDKDHYQAAIQYFKYIHNDEKDLFVHELIAKHAQSIRPDGIFYPCFDFSFMKNEFSLFSITNFENKKLGIDSEFTKKLFYKGFGDSRKCHMIEGNNKLVADMFINRLNGKHSIINESMLAAPTHGANYYFQSKLISIK